MRYLYALVAVAVPQLALAQNTPVEKWVQAQTEAGQIADLSDESIACDRDEDDRCELDGRVLASLLENKSGKVTRAGVRIRHARIKNLNLRAATLPYMVGLADCHIDVLDGSDLVAEGIVSFKDSTIGSLDLTRAQFKRSLFFERATFEESVQLIATSVNGNLQASDAKFHGRCGARKIVSATIKRDLYLDRAEFDGPTLLVNTHVGGVLNARQIQVTDEHQCKGASFDWSRVDVEGDFQLDGDAIQPTEFFSTHPVYFNGIVVRGKLTLRYVVFAGAMQMLDAQVGILSLRDVTLSAARPISFEGLKFSRLELEGTPWNDAFDGVALSSGLLVELEDYFRGIGDSRTADKVFISRKDQERDGLSGRVARAWSHIECVVVGYGKEPWKALLFSLGIVVFGVLLFRAPERMVAVEGKDEARTYNPLWYSLGEFLPIVNLGNSDWAPRKDRPFARHYLKVHRLLGWFLVPFVIASLSLSQ
jgi:hypothetical protein